MRNLLRYAGVFLVAAGISGAVDHLAVQPFLGVVLNVFNRVVIPAVEVLRGYELYANLSIALLGAVLVAASMAVRE